MLGIHMSRTGIRRVIRMHGASAFVGVVFALAGCESPQRESTTPYVPARNPAAQPGGANTVGATASARPSSPVQQPPGSATPVTGQAPRSSLSGDPGLTPISSPPTAPGATPPRTEPSTPTTASPPTPAPVAAAPAPAPKPVTPASPIESARLLIDAGKLIEARESLNHVVQREPNSAEGADARALMTNLAEQTIYSPRVFPDDPLMTTRKVAPSELLVKIAGEFNVPHEVIQQINGIADATKVRAGQVLKMPRGPFHARIYKSQFRLDLYLQDTFVRSFRVGLGEDNGTPEGTWSVTERISNPTYYPPASAKDRRKIDGNDPSNPLGEHWIGLKGVDGAAVGQTGFGIHGTIEPDSIGRSASMGCVRMHNEDVAFVFNALAPRQSTVTILP